MSQQPPDSFDELALAAAQHAVRTEAEAVTDLLLGLDETFLRALHVIWDAPGRVVVTALGKPGHVGRKIAATMASTGTPAVFVHATEALHGDSGVVAAGDVLIAISNSGATSEVCEFAELASRRGVPVIALVGDRTSRLAQLAAVALLVGIGREADPLGLAPTASTTAALALGDAIACALMAVRGFCAEDFATHHPGGSLGARLRESGATT